MMRTMKWWPLILLFTLFASVMSGCDWRHPDPREPVIAPAANDAKVTSDTAPSSEQSSDDRRDADAP
jgi:hypothetical protein